MENKWEWEKNRGRFSLVSLFFLWAWSNALWLRGICSSPSPPTGLCRLLPLSHMPVTLPTYLSILFCTTSYLRGILFLWSHQAEWVLDTPELNYLNTSKHGGTLRKESWHIVIFKDYFTDASKDEYTFLKVPLSLALFFKVKNIPLTRKSVLGLYYSHFETWHLKIFWLEFLNLSSKKHEAER